MNNREHELNKGLKIVNKAKEHEKNGYYDHAAIKYKEARDLFKKIGQHKLSAQCLAAHVANMVKYNLGTRDIEFSSSNMIEFYIQKLEKIGSQELSKSEEYEILISVYRELEKIFHDINRIDNENEMYYKRMSLYHKLYWQKIRQKNMKYKERLKYSSQFIYRAFLQLFYVNGKRPSLALLWIFSTILIFAGIYNIFDLIKFTYPQKAICFWQSLYFSVVTFTTLGYGDIAPTSIIGQFLAILEVLLGIITIALLIPLIIKKLE